MIKRIYWLRKYTQNYFSVNEKDKKRNHNLFSRKREIKKEKEKLSATLSFFVEKKSEKQILYSDF